MGGGSDASSMGGSGGRDGITGVGHAELGSQLPSHWRQGRPDAYQAAATLHGTRFVFYSSPHALPARVDSRTASCHNGGKSSSGVTWESQHLQFFGAARVVGAVGALQRRRPRIPSIRLHAILQPFCG